MQSSKGQVYLMGQLQVMMVMIGYAENHKAKFKLYDKKKQQQQSKPHQATRLHIY